METRSKAKQRNQDSSSQNAPRIGPVAIHPPPLSDKDFEGARPEFYAREYQSLIDRATRFMPHAEEADDQYRRRLKKLPPHEYPQIITPVFLIGLLFFTCSSMLATAFLLVSLIEDDVQRNSDTRIMKALSIGASFFFVLLLAMWIYWRETYSRIMANIGARIELSMVNRLTILITACKLYLSIVETDETVRQKHMLIDLQHKLFHITTATIRRTELTLMVNNGSSFDVIPVPPAPSSSSSQQKEE